MIPYSKTTIRDIALEAEAIIREYINEFNYDIDTMIYYIIQSCRAVILSLIPYQLYNFVESVEVRHADTLPLNFVKEIRLIITNLSNKPEARRVDIKEWYRLTNWKRKHKWNYASTQSPIYTITGAVSDPLILNFTGRMLSIYISPNKDFQLNNTPPSGYEYYLEDDLIGILEYYAVPSFNLTLDSNFPLPDQYRNMIVLMVALRFLAQYSDNYYSLNLHKELFNMKKQMLAQYQKEKIYERRELDVFVAPVPPLFNPPPIREELPSKL